MTLVASWLSFEPHTQMAIWLASDSKISKDKNTVYTMEGAKVMELQVCCKSFSGPNWGEVLTRKSLGFGFAGSTLVALNTYAALTTILSNLSLGRGIKMGPDANSILQTAAKVFKHYLQSIQSDSSMFIAGFCPRNHTPFIGTLKSKCGGDNGVEVTIDLKSFERTPGHLEVQLIGSHVGEIKHRIQDQIMTTSIMAGSDYWRIPLHVLNNIIKAGEFPEIGGGLQVAVIGEQYGFRHHAVTEDTPINKDFIYRNINLDELIGDFVGDCFFKLPALIIPQ